MFCGTAPSRISFARRAYYANPGNAFWPTLHAVGLLPERFAPERWPELAHHGIGLTDLDKTEIGSDHELSPAAIRPDLAARRIARAAPAAVAFTSKNAASLFFGLRSLEWGRQPPAVVDRLGSAALRQIVWFALPSPSGRARGSWDVAPWREAAAFVARRRAARAG